MERAIKKRLYVYTIGMFLATVVVVSLSQYIMNTG